MPPADERITRVEARMDAQAVKLSEVAEKVQWIKGYLETHGNGRKPARDAAMVVRVLLLLG